MERVIQGIVQGGLGQGNSFTQLDWVRQQFRDKIGFDPYPGTLNLRVQDRDGLARKPFGRDHDVGNDKDAECNDHKV